MNQEGFCATIREHKEMIMEATLRAFETTSPYRHVVLAFISSRIPQDLLPTDIMLDAKPPDFAATGLHVTSTLRLHRLMTAASSLFKRELGTLPLAIQTEIAGKLGRWFELENR